MKKLIFILFFGLVFSGQAVAGIIAGDICQVYEVNAAGYGNSDDCIGLLNKSSGPGVPSGNPFDSESFLNNAQWYDDLTDDSVDNPEMIWDATGAFGHNDWEFLGKDEQEDGQTFIDATSGSPATWTVDKLLYGSFTIAVKQGNDIGYWYFTDLNAVSAGELFINDMFGDGTDDDGWSHVSIYKTGDSYIPEPSIIALFGAGLIGFGLVGRRRNRK